MLSNHNSADSLRDEILSQARHESEEILRLARAQAQTLLAQRAARAEQAREERIAQAQAEATRCRQLTLATVPVQVARLRALHVETLLQTIYQDVRRRLQAKEGLDYSTTVIELVAAAVDQMHGGSFVIRLPSSDRALLEETLVDDIKRHLRRSAPDITVRWEPGLAEHGPIVEDAEGRQRWDNRLLPRLDRLWPELRRRLAIATGLAATPHHSQQIT